MQRHSIYVNLLLQLFLKDSLTKDFGKCQLASSAIFEETASRRILTMALIPNAHSHFQVQLIDRFLHKISLNFQKPLNKISLIFLQFVAQTLKAKSCDSLSGHGKYAIADVKWKSAMFSSISAHSTAQGLEFILYSIPVQSRNDTTFNPLVRKYFFKKSSQLNTSHKQNRSLSLQR